MHVRLALLSALLLLPVALRADTYTYTGNDFTTVTGSYTTSDKITGSFTIAGTLADSTATLISPSAFSFSDGLAPAITQATSIHFEDPMSVTTNASGQIIAWDFSFTLYTAQYLTTNFKDGGDQDLAGYGTSTAEGGGSPTTPQGSWVDSTTTTSAVPEPSSFALMSAALLAFVFVARKRLVAGVL
jgi:hypothetical protein